MKNTQAHLLRVPLGGDAHRLAQQFAAQQATRQKGKQVYLNTLAVYAVHSYLKWLQIETSLHQSDSWHPGKRAIFDVADLVLPGIGQLECRPVLPKETALDLPPEVTENPIGYVGVQLDENLSEVELLGFAPAVDYNNPPEQLQVSEFQPLDVLLDHIYHLKNVAFPAQKADSTAEKRANLRQWFDNIFDAGWQAVETILGNSQTELAFRFRNPEASVRRCKLIELGMTDQSVGLIVALTPESEAEMDIMVEVHPVKGQTYLPANLQLMLLDEVGEMVMDIQARSENKNIQLEFTGESGDCFSLKVGVGDVSIIEEFII
ncbi:DUF1822 family protein [Microseira wollei]|uniref:DUF1822 family protein n=1 Tax=Microseira wollei NIES-4236 TaxID=2530354 RepID=A0AAV3X8J4_9CYAN|nr:DUF1822 family protein [Microseira wollei]GET38723.1 hypothetical protein MiSe_34820 [Microseira wollei NIES-4236]